MIGANRGSVISLNGSVRVSGTDHSRASFALKILFKILVIERQGSKPMPFTLGQLP
jgi:hypothetical protein